MSALAKLPVLGRVEIVDFPDAEVFNMPAKIDTGAYRSSIWATKIREEGGVLYFTLLGPSSPYYSGKEQSTRRYKQVEVENSFGHKQTRYSIFLKIKIADKTIKSNFTLANRSTKTYSALVGRKLLKSRFVVDVNTGQPIRDEETHGDNSLE